jgi:hypothetical protein
MTTSVSLLRYVKDLPTSLWIGESLSEVPILVHSGTLLLFAQLSFFCTMLSVPTTMETRTIHNHIPDAEW